MTITLDGRKLMANVTMKVKIVQSREMKLRVWVARQLFFLAARVLGCKIKMTFNLVKKA